MSNSTRTMDDAMNGGSRVPQGNEDAPVQSTNPIELFVHLDELAGILERTAASLRRNRLPPGIDDPADDAELNLALAETEALLEWVRNYRGDPKNVFIGLYIASEYKRQ